MRRRSTFQPVVFCDPFAMAGNRKVAVELGPDGHILCLEWSVGDYCVRSLNIEAPSLGTRYLPVNQPVAGQAASFKISALTHGATPEAIRLLGLICPLTKQEEAMMAEKLKTKGSVKAADKEGLKAAAKDAPVGKKPKVAPAEAKAEAPKKRGNAEALAKAREARKEAGSGPDKRKITVLKKDHGARAGTDRQKTLDLLFKHKTAQSALDAGVTKQWLAWADREGYVELS